MAADRPLAFQRPIHSAESTRLGELATYTPYRPRDVCYGTRIMDGTGCLRTPDTIRCRCVCGLSPSKAIYP